VIVHGAVQGVGFRAAVQRAAASRGVRGWVQNRSDGTVEALVEGDPEAVAAVIRFCESGPPLAEVERVEVSDAVDDDDDIPSARFGVR